MHNVTALWFGFLLCEKGRWESLRPKQSFWVSLGIAMEPLTRPFKIFPEANGAADLGAKLRTEKGNAECLKRWTVFPMTCVGVRRCAWVTEKIPSCLATSEGHFLVFLSPKNLQQIHYHSQSHSPHGFAYFRTGKEIHFCTCLHLPPLVLSPIQTST